jgi:hypothetical protein
MATLIRTATWIHLLSTGEFVTAQTKDGRGLTRKMAGERRQYAGGRFRAYTVAGVMTDYQLALVYITATQGDLLDEWMGETVQVTDNLGQLVYGFYLEVPRIPYEDGSFRFDCPLTILGTTVEDE